MHLNIRSIRKIFEFIKETESDFYILCFTETHLHNNIPNKDVIIEGFKNVPFRKDVSPILLDYILKLEKV